MLTSDSTAVSRNLRIKHSEYWVNLGRRRALRLFHQVSQRVPAYRDFLLKNKIRSPKIRTWLDFQQIPPINKKNYLRVYPLEKLHWDGTIRRPFVWTSTSGSTGESVYFSRHHALDLQYATFLEEYLRNSSYGVEGPTLIIIGFAMGIWIGGLITYQAYELAGRHSRLPISIITPGINKSEIIKTLKNLGHHFRQIILVGYPPFIKDVIDEALAEKIPLHKLHLRFHFAAEAITETFRDYLRDAAKINNIYRDTLNIYGSADIGAMAYEGSTSIMIKRLALTNRHLFASLFSEIPKIPTLAQFNPAQIQFESAEGELLLTGDNSIPLIRYTIGDHGGTFSFAKQVEVLAKYGISFKREAQRAGISEIVHQLPFVYVYERADFSTTLYGINIYPEIIREALLDKTVRNFLSGKFTLLTKYDQHQNQLLEINMELRKNQKVVIPLKKKVLRVIDKRLKMKSSEYRELSKQLQGRLVFSLHFWPFSHPKYFNTGVKQKWILR